MISYHKELIVSEHDVVTKLNSMIPFVLSGFSCKRLMHNKALPVTYIVYKIYVQEARDATQCAEEFREICRNLLHNLKSKSDSKNACNSSNVGSQLLVASVHENGAL